MTLLQSILAYVLAALSFLALDAVWLSTMAERLYRPAIGHLMAERFAPAPAVAFYALYVAGIVYFAIAPALAERRPMAAAVHGALLGLLAYATYDLTNQATLRDWPWQVTVADLAWGAFATAAAAGVACWGTLRLAALIGAR